MNSHQPLFKKTSDGRKPKARAATAWRWLTSPRHVAPTSRPLPGAALTPHTPAIRFGATPVGRLRLQATCEAIASGYSQGDSMARFFTSQFPYDSEQLDSVLSRGDDDWPRHQCGMDEIR